MTAARKNQGPSDVCTPASECNYVMQSALLFQTGLVISCAVSSQNKVSRLRVLRLRRRARVAVEDGCDARHKSRAGGGGKRGAGDMLATAASASDRQLQGSFLDELAAAAEADATLVGRIAAAMQPATPLHEEASSESASDEPLERIVKATVIGSGHAVTAADVEHLACLLRLSGAATADAVADCIRCES